MKPLHFLIASFLSLSALLAGTNTATGATPETAGEIRIDIPVALKKAKVVFNMDHAAFGSDTPVGLAHMTMMMDRFKQIGTEWSIAAIFHGDAGYMRLNDEAYHLVRKTQSGNRLARGDLPGVGRVVIDGIVRCDRTRNTPPTTAVPLVLAGH